MRAADYDDWITPTVAIGGRSARPERRHPRLEPGHPSPPRADLHGHPRHEGDPGQPAEEAGQQDFLELPYHQAILNDEIPLSIGGGIGQSRTYMYLLRTAHLGEVTVTVWPES
jgi:aspartate--ammonia ligase